MLLPPHQQTASKYSKPIFKDMLPFSHVTDKDQLYPHYDRKTKQKRKAKLISMQQPR